MLIGGERKLELIQLKEKYLKKINRTFFVASVQGHRVGPQNYSLPVRDPLNSGSGL